MDAKMPWERGWFLNFSAVSSLNELDHLKVDITYSVHTHTRTHTSQNTLIQPTVGLNKFKYMLGKWSVCRAWHTLGQHEESPGLDFIKYGTTNLAPINFYDSSPTDFCGVLRRSARAPAVAGAPSWIVLFLSHKSSSVGNWRVRQIWDGSEPAEVIKIWNIKLRC